MTDADTDILGSRVADGRYKADIYDITLFNFKNMYNKLLQ